MYPRLSWSTLQMLEECPARYLLHRQRKRKPIPERYVLVGSVIHGVSENKALRRMTDDQMVEQAVLDFDRRVIESFTLGWDMAEVNEQRSRVVAGSRRLLELLDQMPVPHQVELHLEKYFQGWGLEGYIDLAVFGTNGTWPHEVWDIKTGSSHKQGQLQFYSVLCEAYFGHRPRSFGWIEPLGRGIVPVSVTDDEHATMKRRIKAAVQMIAAGDLPTSGFPSKCSRCSSEPFCPATDKARSGLIGKV